VGVSSLEISLCDSNWFFEKIKTESPFEYSKKTARYDAKKNCLQIWDGEFPIYENDNGTIKQKLPTSLQ
jgi:hypothetical protein